MQKHFNLFTLMLSFLFTLSAFTAERDTSLTILYSGEEHGQLGVHGCGVEQVGGLAHRQTLLTNLRAQYNPVLNLHIGNLIDVADPNAEWIYQIGLAALAEMNTDVMCLGPNELALSRETLLALHANHPEIGVVCANLTEPIGTLYQICSVASLRVAVVNLVSQSHEQELPSIGFMPPQTALRQLKSELHSKSDVVVIVFHALQEEAQALAEAMPWIDVLIVASNQEIKMTRKTEFITVEKTTLVTNATQGAAVGVLEFGNPVKVQQIAVSERLVPNGELSKVLTFYQQLSETADFETNRANEHSNSVHITYFHKQGCQKCTRAVKILKILKAKYPQVVVEKRAAKEEQALLEAMGNLYEISQAKRLTTPALFIGDSALIGELDERRLEMVVQKYIARGVASRISQAEAYLATTESEIVNRFHGFGVFAVAGAGLLDGINPCAFATIVFFISYMNLVGRGRRDILIAGGTFGFAVFVTYLLLGLGTLSFMKYLNQFSGIATCVYLLAALATFSLAFLSLYDALKAKQGKTKDIKLQLPKALKLRIHKVIWEQTRTSGVILGSFVIGVAISALELVCTGQVYLPTITFVAGVEGMRRHAFAHLLLYNLMFIVPLLAVFGSVYWGTTSLQLGGVLQRHLVSVKIGIGILLLGLGIWLILSLV